MSAAFALLLQARHSPSLLRANYYKPCALIKQQTQRNVRHLLRSSKFGPSHSQASNQITRNTTIQPRSNPLGALRPIIKPLLFTLTFTGSCYTIATIYQYENSKFRHWSPLERSPFFMDKVGKFRNTLNTWNNSLSLSERIVASIIMINVLVFVSWRLLPQSQFMRRYFLNIVDNLNGSRSQAKIRCLPLLLSGFSHISLLHLGFNMYAFNSFSGDVCFKMGPEHFLGFFLSACVFSSFISSAFKLLVRAQMPSIGASGGLMGMIYFSAITSPQSQLGIIGLPSQFSFNALNGVTCLFLFDTIGLLMRWSRLDHAAHLGGAILGILYAYYGHHLALRYRTRIIETWAKIRKP